MEGKELDTWDSPCGCSSQCGECGEGIQDCWKIKQYLGFCPIFFQFQADTVFVYLWLWCCFRFRCFRCYAVCSCTYNWEHDLLVSTLAVVAERARTRRLRCSRVLFRGRRGTQRSPLAEPKSETLGWWWESSSGRAARSAQLPAHQRCHPQLVFDTEIHHMLVWFNFFNQNQRSCEAP